MNTIVLVTGGFDPLHSGHIDYFKAAKKLGDKLIVGVNSDDWLTRKKGRPFMPLTERISIIQALGIVDNVISFDDSDDSACGAIFKTMSTNTGKIIFANGGDRTNTTTPEYATYGDHPAVEFAFGVGGTDKKNSSSWILEEWKSPKTIRPWGWYRVLDQQKGYKVKELVINPNSRLSMQRHDKRSEHWYVLKGECLVGTINKSSDFEIWAELKTNMSMHISQKEWHQGINEKDEPCHILEVQYGPYCEEDDIERA
jgi:cytidyltransferase-like protein